MIICEWLRQDVSVMKLFFIQNKAFNVNPSALREILNPYNNIDKTYLHSYDTQKQVRKKDVGRYVT